MAKIDILSETKIRISVTLSDAIRMLQEAASNVSSYAEDIVTIYEKMPAFDYTSFCFYAYDSARLFEWMLETDPRQYNSFSLDAPDAFFYALYGGMAALYPSAQKELAGTASASV